MDNNTPITNTANPISLYHSGGLTQKQSDAYNALLTQLAKVIANLQDRVASNMMLDKRSNAIACWLFILNDLAAVILPEFYVVFHDKTTLAMQRRRLYDITQAIYFALVNYDKTVFLQKIALCDGNIDVTQHNTTPYKPSFSQNIDSYITGKGVNAEIAYKLKDMADFVTVDGLYYLDKFEPYYNLLINEQKLLQYITDNTLKELQHELDKLQKKRYLAFSIPTLKVIQTQPILSTANSAHLLATWILQEYLHLNPHSLDNANATTNTSATKNTLITSSHPNPPLVTNPKQLQKAVIIGGGALLVLASMAAGSIALSVLFSIVFSPILLWSSTLAINALNLDAYGDNIKQMSGIAVVVSVIWLFSGGLFVAIALPAFILSTFLLTQSSSNQAKKAKKALTLTQADPDAPIFNQHGTGSYQQLTQKFDAIKNSAVDAEAKTVTSSKNYDLPLALERHGYHLAILLSQQSTEHLQQLISATNTLYNHLGYLQDAYPYLATRVDELITDLTHNTLVRLDEMASQFVKDGQVNSEAQALFAEQHEARIDELIVLNLNQVKNLNQTILEKQMAGFADIGNTDERKFRDTVMELKILLRWIIAQQPDEIQASSHQVILDNLQSTTLTDMQATFFDSQTTSEQRTELQHQLELLLNHFKNQTIQDIQLHSINNNDHEIQALLQLSKSSANPLNPDTSTDDIATDIDAASSQTKTQRFIDFNKHYIKQLLTHWH